MTVSLPPHTVVNPEFVADEEVRDLVADECRDLQSYAMALPDRFGAEVPPEGAWIIVKTVPYTELVDRFDLPLYSIWRARPFYKHRQFKLKVPRMTNVQWPMLHAVIETPGGELHLLPDEYVTTDIERWLEFVGQGLSIHFLGAGEPGEFADQLFYLQAHGLPRREALMLLLPNLTDANFCYFTIDEDVLS